MEDKKIITFGAYISFGKLDSVDWEFEGITFPNKRVDYTYLCKVEKGDYETLGLEGEFDEGTIVKWCTLKELEELGMWGPTLELVKKVEREHLEV